MQSLCFEDTHVLKVGLGVEFDMPPICLIVVVQQPSSSYVPHLG